MAGTPVTIRQEFMDGTEVEKLRLANNALVVDVERLRAALNAVCVILDADTGVAASNTAATANVATAGTMTGYTVSTYDG